ncbi:MAG: tetratricopeptide repeat protein [Candidatus Eisenbacteria bacterium]
MRSVHPGRRGSRFLIWFALLSALQVTPVDGIISLAFAREPGEVVDPVDNAINEARGLLRIGRKDEGLAKLRQLHIDHPNHTRVLLYLGKQLAENGHGDEAISLYRDGLSAVEEAGPILIDLERLYREAKRWPDAVDTCLEYQSRLGDAGGWVENELESLIRSDRLGEEAVRAMEKAAEKHPDDASLSRLFVLALFFNGQGTKALERAAALDEKQGGKGDALLAYAGMALDKAAFADARQAYELALQRNLVGSRREEVLYRRAQLLRKERALDASLAAYDEVIAANPDGNYARPARLEKAQILMQELNRKADALATYRQLLASVSPARKKADIEFADQTRLAMADCELSLERPADAESLYAQLADSARSPDVRVAALFQQAEMRFYQGKLKDAEKLYYKLTDLYPTDQWVNDALERILQIGENASGGGGLTAVAQADYQRRLGHHDRALVLLDEALEAAPKAPVSDDLLLSRVRTLLEMGRTAEAETSADTLAARFADSPLAPRALFETAGRWAEREESRDAAIALYEKILLRFPNCLEAPDARAALLDLKGRAKQTSFDPNAAPRNGGG